jgi:chromosome segregation ATPase
LEGQAAEAPSDTAQQAVLEPPESSELSPFQGETFDSETQAAFAALEAGANEAVAKPAPEGGDMVDLRSLWSDEDLPPSLGWEAPPKTIATPADHDVFRPSTLAEDNDGIEPADDDEDVHPVTSPQLPVIAASTYSDDVVGVPPSPDEVEHIEESLHESAAPAPVMVVDDRALREAEARNVELEARIGSLENERKTLRKELEEARERFNQTATFSKEREFLALREIINKKEKDILDLREDLDAKERQVLDHKDKIRELDRSRRDLEEKTLGFERSVVASTEKISELLGERDKSAEREKGLKARLDDAHGENHKARDEVEAIRKRMAQEDARAKGEAERARADFELRLRETEEAHRTEVGRLKDEQSAGGAATETAHHTELARIDAAHKAEVEGLQKRLADEQAAATERFTSEVARLRREHEKAIAASKEEQGLQLTSERQAYEALTEAKERDHRNEILGMRRRHEEELTAAEERRQRDIVEQEQRRIAELDAAEGRRRAELQTRDENHHQRVTEIERRHLNEKTELGEKHRSDHDQALGRAARAEGELAARVQEVDQSHRRVSSLEADLDAARAEVGDRDVRIAQTRDRIAELESKVTDYEDQIVRAYQRLRADEKTTEKARRALAVALALIDERASVPVGVGAGAKSSASAAVSEDGNAKG